MQGQDDKELCIADCCSCFKQKWSLHFQGLISEHAVMQTLHLIHVLPLALNRFSLWNIHLNHVASDRTEIKFIFVTAWEQTNETCSLKWEGKKRRNDLLAAPSNRASWCSALITSELHLGCFGRYCSIALWFNIVLWNISTSSRRDSFAYESLDTKCIPHTVFSRLVSPRCL